MIRIWSIDESLPVDSPSFVETSRNAVTPYLKKFLTAPHPFRKGVMCPFMPKALASNDVHFTYFDSKCKDQELQNLIRFCVEFYKSRHDTSFGAIIILFESEFDILRLLRAHIDAKANCIENGVMLGALYKDSPASSLHSEEYFPLRTPTPILVLRDLTVQDLQFLNPDHYGVLAKLKFLNSFIQKFSAPPMKGYAKNQVNEAKLLRRSYRIHLGIRFGLFTILIGCIVAFCTYRWLT